MNGSPQQGGFTLIETMVGIVLLATLATIGVFSLSKLQRSVDVNATAQQIIATLQLARSRTQAAVSDTNYGVHFETDFYVLYTGPNYDGLATDNEMHLLDSNLELYDIAVNGGNNVLFDRIHGTTSNSGTISIRQIDNVDNNRTISILPSGLLGQPTDPAPTPTTSARLSDSRHLHFNLGWSLQNASALNLTFSDPATVESISMSDYFNADQSEFDWEGVISVGGSGQSLRVHTHTLTSTDTVLSITRDRRYNDKALTIDIDGQYIVTYAADGEATVGGSGGTMTEQ